MIHYGIKQLLKRWVLRLKWHGKLQFEQGCDIALQAQFEGMNKIYSHSSFGGILGYGSYIGHHSSLTAKIGRFCSISNHVICNHGIHPFQAPFATTSPVFSLFVSKTEPLSLPDKCLLNCEQPMMTNVLVVKSVTMYGFAREYSSMVAFILPTERWCLPTPLSRKMFHPMPSWAVFRLKSLAIAMTKQR